VLPFINGFADSLGKGILQHKYIVVEKCVCERGGKYRKMHLMVWSSKCGRKKWGVWNSKMRWLSVKEKRMVGQCFRAGMKKKTESQSKEINWVGKS